ncbi:MAG: Uma2 family endonuclease [Planctomycetes bacterium]|nr:Uma2 family endonuclease [Planctomycetota bacterium]
MKAVMANVPEHILEWRRRTGADQWDEMWEGVLHMAPSPNRDHQDFELSLAMWLRLHWAKATSGRVYTRINVAEPGTWPDNYRIPDIVLLTPNRFAIDHNEYFNGGPDAVIEIYSPGDETYEKLDFYAKLNVREVWVCDRDTKRPTIFMLTMGKYQVVEADDEGWIRSNVANCELRATADGELKIRLSGRGETQARLP